MKIEIVSVHGSGFILKRDDDLHAFAFRARREVRQRMSYRRSCARTRLRRTSAGVGTEALYKSEGQSRMPPCEIPTSRKRGETWGTLTSNYQTWHAFTGSIGWPALHPNAFPNSGIFSITPLVRNLRSESADRSAPTVCDLLGSGVTAPILREGQKEMLQGRVLHPASASSAMFLRLASSMNANIGQAQAAVVGCIFAQRPACR